MKKITVAVCVDDEGGMLFYGKRQSRDRHLISELIEWADGRRIYIYPFSKALFPDEGTAVIAADPITECTDGGICFIENLDILPYIDSVGELVIYRWNRLYPSDKKLDINPISQGFVLKETTDFVGSSHEKITKEVYRK
ncbi:MAG: ribonuclease Z [Ruminococcaceae bacterium]|nr:ribonuclease Z [Oscillospiraceae bacterium]